MKKREFIGLRVEAELLEAIDNMAKKQRRTRSNMVEFILKEWIEQHKLDDIPLDNQQAAT
jgi:metal-responsive CopG/Arc/MetJ family transcriptional regulator